MSPRRILRSCVALFCGVTVHLAAFTLPEVDQLALDAFYVATGGDNWTDNGGWTGPIAGRFGVTVDNVSGRVIRLEVPGNNLVGSLDDTDLAAAVQAGGLGFLQVLDLGDNELAGRVPDWLTGLANLGVLQLRLNRLDGTLPDSIGDLTSLWNLQIQGNAIEGPVPSSFATMNGLEVLALDHNKLYNSDPKNDPILDRDGNWRDTQTIPPSGLAVESIADTSAQVVWTAIPYSADAGRYEIGLRVGIEPIVYLSSTNDKTATSGGLSDLSPATAYDFAVRTVTDSHANNKNQLVSDPAIVSATTTGGAGAGTLRLAASSYAPGEGAGTLILSVLREGGSAGAVGVDIQTVPGSALEGSDYSGTNGDPVALSWADGETTAQTLTVTILQDGEVEGDESFSVQLGTPSGGASLGSPSTATVTIGDDDVAPPPVPLVRLVTAAQLLFEGQGVGLVVQMDQATTVPVTVTFAADAVFAGDFSNFPAAADLTIPAGAVQGTFPLQTVQDQVAEIIASGSVRLVSSNGGTIDTAADAVAIELRDEDADPEPLDATLRGNPALPVGVTVGESLLAYALDGTPPYQITVDGGARGRLGSLYGAYDVDGDGDNDHASVCTVVPLREGLGTITIADAAGDSVQLTFTATALPARSLPPPPLPLSDGETIFTPICGGTPQGLAVLLKLAQSNDTTVFKAGVWDAVDQAWVQLPAQPDGGVLPGHGVFVASREALPIDLSGWPAPRPWSTTLHPGWNFIGLPALDSGINQVDLVDLQFSDEGGFAIAAADRPGLVGEAVHLWDGASYQAVTRLVAGRGYWIFNASSDPAQVLTLTVPEGVGMTKTAVAAAGASTGYRRKTVDNSPPAPGGRISGGSSSPIGGCGSGIGLILPALMLLGLIQLGRLRDEC